MDINTRSLKTMLPLWSASVAAVLFFLYGTSPDSVGPIGVTVFFAVAYVCAALSLQVTMLILLRLLARPGRLNSWRMLYSFVLAFLPVTVVGLGTLDQLVIRDVVLFASLIGLILFYVATSSKK